MMRRVARTMLASWILVSAPWLLGEERVSSPVEIMLGRSAAAAEVRTKVATSTQSDGPDGKTVGVAWHPPFRLDATDALCPGENRLEIRVANLWHNRLVGDADLPKTKRVTRMVPELHYERLHGHKLMDSGLIGPVRIVAQIR